MTTLLNSVLELFNYPSIIVFCIASFIIGSIPFGLIVTKISGYGDIRKIGSGNVGTTNVLRAGGKKLATIVLLLDVTKGYLPILIFSFLYSKQLQPFEIIFFGSFSVIGHIFPVWLKFKGGKGVASYIGFILGINFILCIIFIICWILIALFKRYSSLSSIFTLIVIPIFSIFLAQDQKISVILILLSILIIFKHIDNIKRLLRNSENKIQL